MLTRYHIFIVCGMLVASTGLSPRCHGQVVASGNKVTSEIDNTFGLRSEVADDFAPSVTGNVTGVTFYGGPFGLTNTATTYNITFYMDGGSVPDAPLASYLAQGIAGIWDHFDTIDGFSIYKYTLNVSVPVLANNLYWLSVQADNHAIPDQWGVERALPMLGDEPYFKSTYFGFPDWTPVSTVTGWMVGIREMYDLNQQVTYGDPVAVERTSWGAVKALYRSLE